MMRAPVGYAIGVHAGAGYHHPSKEEAYKSDLRRAAKAAAACLDRGGDALAAAEAATRVLEDSPLSNAGRGSNLTLGGVVECDASCMDSDGGFGAVAAVPGIANPVAAAATLLRDGREPLSHGRVRPMVLAGDAARRWALERGLAAASTPEEAREMHVTEGARRQWAKYRQLIDGGAAPPGGGGGPAPKRQRRQASHGAADHGECVVHDTVGCVVALADGHLAAAVSSGGIAVKREGRVGEAGAYGAGCWATFCSGAEAPPAAAPCAAASVTGVGEKVMRHLLAREAAARLEALGPRGADPRAVAAAGARLLEETLMREGPPNDAGVLCVLAGGGRGGAWVHLLAAHCARSMAVATLVKGPGQAAGAAEARVLRREEGQPPATLVVGVPLWN